MKKVLLVAVLLIIAGLTLGGILGGIDKMGDYINSVTQTPTADVEKAMEGESSAPSDNISSGILSNAPPSDSTPRTTSLPSRKNETPTQKSEAGKWTTYTEVNGHPLKKVYSIAVDSANNVWFGTFGYGISVFDGSNWTTYTEEDGLASNNISTIVFDHSGNVWVGTYDKGVSVFDGKSWKTYTEEDGLATNHVYKIAIDANNNVWFGCAQEYEEEEIGEGCISMFDGTRFKTYTKKDGLGDSIKFSNSLLIDRNNNVWAVTTEVGETCMFEIDIKFKEDLNRGIITEALKDAFKAGGPPLSDNFTIAREKEGEWRITDGKRNFTIREDYGRLKVYGKWKWKYGVEHLGISRFDGKNWKTYMKEDGLPSNYISAMVVDHNNNVWVGGNMGGVSVFNGTGWKNYPESVVGSGIFDLEVDHNNNIWAATANGISMFDGNNWTINKIGSPALEIMIDKNNNVWATTAKGIYMFDGESWRRYTEKDGLISNYIFSLAADKNNNVWFGAQEGVSEYHSVK